MKVKCRKCGHKKEKDQAYLHIHVTSGGNKQNRWYCSKDCYENEQKEIFMLKQCQYFVDEVFGYVVVSNQKNKCLKELVDAGYTREQVYDCMLELKSTIIESLEYRKDIKDESQRVMYMYAIIKSKIREITTRNELSKKHKEKIRQEYEEIEYIPQDNFKSNKRKSLSDRLGGK